MTGALVIPRTAFEIRTALALKTALRPVTLPKKAQQMSGVKTFLHVRLSLSHVANLNVLLKGLLVERCLCFS